MLYDNIGDLIDEAQDDKESLIDKLHNVYNYDPTFDLNINNEELLNKIYDDLEKVYSSKIELFGDEYFKKIEKYIMLEVLDSKWRDNLKNLAELREGINLQSYGQKNPVNEYKIVSADVYNDMIQSIKRDTTSFLLRIKPQVQEEAPKEEEEQEFVSRRERRNR